jgi:hypothetical protein
MLDQVRMWCNMSEDKAAQKLRKQHWNVLKHLVKKIFNHISCADNMYNTATKQND